jgi:RimJ/RimL family protein N-acetyltransferase
VDDGATMLREEAEHWIPVCQHKFAQRGDGTPAVFEKSTNQFIGQYGVIPAPDNDFDELMYVYHVAVWGNGYATEAGHAMIAYVFGHTTLEHIHATIYPDSRASIKVVEKLGFVSSGRQPMITVYLLPTISLVEQNGRETSCRIWSICGRPTRSIYFAYW